MTTYSILNERDYYRTVYGGWLGKNIGGTLGAPVEGRKNLLDLTFYPVLRDGPLENDDLDLQLVWLHALEQYGPRLTSRELGQEWVEHVFFPYDEYGYALANLRRGLLPPVAGAFNNPFTDCMGSPIRSEIWAMVAPGAPQVAAYYAYQDAVVDHAGGEGVYGEVFFAAIESAAFVEHDRDRLIRIGLSYIPETCRTAKAVKDLLQWHRDGVEWREARERILQVHGRDNFTDAPQNIAFTILGWLYGRDFEDAILKAVNCGYDTDCTAATLGAILGMLSGPEDLPAKWVGPVGDTIVVSPPVKGFPAPRSLDELTRRTMHMGKQVLAAWDTGILVHPEEVTKWSGTDLHADDTIRQLWSEDVRADRRRLPRSAWGRQGIELLLDYGEGGPSIGRMKSKPIKLTLANHSQECWEGSLALEVPKDWQEERKQPFSLQPGDSRSFGFELSVAAAADDSGAQTGPSHAAASTAAGAYELAAVITRRHDDAVWTSYKEPFFLVPAHEWIVWGPDHREGIPLVCSGSRIEWEAVLPMAADGPYRARTMLHNPQERKISLVTASSTPVTARLNGELIIDCRQHPAQCMPAFHRSPDNQQAILELPAGSHELDITAYKNGAPLQVYILPVATKQTKQPGSSYYHTDITFWHRD